MPQASLPQPAFGASTVSPTEAVIADGAVIGTAISVVSEPKAVDAETPEEIGTRSCTPASPIADVKPNPDNATE